MRERHDATTWRASLAAALPSLRGGSPQVSFVSVVRELGEWVARATPDAWDHKDNAASLLADLTATFDIAGSRFKALFEVSYTTLAAALGQMFGSSVDRTAAKSALDRACQHALALLSEQRTRAAVWEDLVKEARTPAPRLPTIQERVALLEALLAQGGVDPGATFLRLKNQLEPTPAAREFDPDVAPPGLPDRDRIQNGRRIVAEVAEPADCVAWMTFDEARLAGCVVPMGKVTFFETDWAFPNSREGGQDFLFRDEVAQIVRQRPEFRRRDHKERRYEVLARVDLGRRLPYDALSDATALLRRCIGLVANRTGAAAWRTGGFSYLAADGEIVQFALHRGSAPRNTNTDHYGQNGFATALKESSDELGQLLDSGALPPDLSEALRLIGEAGQVDSRDNVLNGTATIAEETVVLLQATVVERIAALAGQSSERLDAFLMKLWPMQEFRADLVESIGWCQRGLGGTDELFNRIIAFSDGNRSISLVNAFDSRDELTARCADRFQRIRAERLFNSIGNSGAALRMLGIYRAEGERRLRRLLRCRHALVHGNPVTAESVASVRPLARFRSDAALEFAISSVVGRRPLTDVLDERASQEDSVLAALGAGEPLQEIWSRA